MNAAGSFFLRNNTRMIKTFQIGTHWFPECPGGLERVYFDLWRALTALGVGFSGLVAGGEMSAAQTGGAVQAFAPPDALLPKRLLAMRVAFSRMETARHAELIVSHFALYTLPILDLTKDQPVVIHFQGPWADEGVIEGDHAWQRAIKYRIERAVYGRAARAIVLSHAFAALLTARYGFPADRIDVIPPGIDVRRFAIGATRAEARARLGWPQDRPVVVVVRRLVPRMGLEALIAAIEILRRSMPDVLLMVAGKGILRSRLDAQIAARGLEAHVKMLGFVADDDLPYVYRAADLSVVPSMALEGFGLIVAESLAAGTPSLVSPVGGLPEGVGGLSRDLIMPLATAEDMAMSLQAALRGDVKLPNSAACRRYAEDSFSWPLVAARVATSYRRALD
jgi:glycosyltransferase involved in cell wall biosynthesis